MANNTLLASDNFASGSLAAGWSPVFGSTKSQVTGSPFVAEPSSTSTPGKQQWTGNSVPNDQISEAQITITSESGTNFALLARMQSGSYSGYAANISNGGAQIYRYDNGTATALGNGSGGSASGLTFAAGDVWSFVAAGAALILYQNGVQICRYGDATYTSGAFGFQQSSAVNVAHCQVQKWRGYTAVQQDGIWTKQGIAFPAINSDLQLGLQNCAILQDTNAQLLAVPAGQQIYKMWFTAGSTGTGYAEALTLAGPWTRKSGIVISGYGYPGIIKNNGTYYCYVQSTSAAGSGDIALYTAADGITFSQVSTTILALGSGTWDDVILWYFQPVIIGGTWYALYNGGNSSSVYQLSVGVATASSPSGPWTKFAGNPVLQDAAGGSIVASAALTQVGSTWYGWFYRMQPHQGNPSVPDLDPGECVRYQSTDFQHWTNPVHSVHRSQLFEGVNYYGGQCYVNGIFDVNGKATLITQSTPSDNPAPQIYQFAIATAPASIASIVQQPENGIQQTATDSFARADGSLGPNWTTPNGGTALQIASQKVEGSALSPCVSAYTGAGAPSSSTPQYSEITIATLAADVGTGISPAVRVQLGSVGYYVANISYTASGGDAVIYKNVNGTFTALNAATATQKFTAAIGDKWRLLIFNGSDGFPVLQLFQNEFLICQSQDYSNAFTSGYVGIYANPTTAISSVQTNLWAGGNANVIPNYPAVGGSWMQPHRDFINKRGVFRG